MLKREFLGSRRDPLVMLLGLLGIAASRIIMQTVGYLLWWPFLSRWVWEVPGPCRHTDPSVAVSHRSPPFLLSFSATEIMHNVIILLGSAALSQPMRALGFTGFSKRWGGWKGAPRSHSVCRWGTSPRESRITPPQMQTPSPRAGIGQEEGEEGLGRREESREVGHCSWIASQKRLLENLNSPSWVRREGQGAGGLVPAPALGWAGWGRGHKELEEQEEAHPGSEQPLTWGWTWRSCRDSSPLRPLLVNPARGRFAFTQKP